MVGASSSSWREGRVRNTVEAVGEAPPAERGLLLRRAPLPVPASLVHCCSLMVQNRLVLLRVALVVVECMFQASEDGAAAAASVRCCSWKPGKKVKSMSRDDRKKLLRGLDAHLRTYGTVLSSFGSSRIPK